MAESSMHSSNIFIIGPARSGTKLFRDILATHGDIEKIPYDINYLWKRFHPEVAHDALSAEDVNERIRDFMGEYLSKKRGDSKYIVEKTVSNTLRVDFVDKVAPNSKFIYLYRDGRDSVESVIRQWGTVPEFRYLARKFLSTPIHLALPYVLQYGKNLLNLKTKNSEPKDYVWGVKFRDYQTALKNQSVNEFCCTQWNECINSMINQQPKLGDRCLTVHYESLVQDTDKTLDQVAEFLELPSRFTASGIKKNRVGYSKDKLDSELYQLLSERLEDNLIRLGYQP